MLVTGLVFSAHAALTKAQLEARIQAYTAAFTTMQQNPATRVPASQLAQAHGIVLLDRTGGALVFGFHSGNGVALVKDESGRWSPAGFVSSVTASLGAQIGGSRDFFVILLMSPATAQSLRASSMDFGAQASGTGGTAQAGAQATLNSGPAVLVYSQHSGLYAGAVIKGRSLSADQRANEVYYGKPVTMDDILFSRNVSPSQATQDLISKIEQFSK